MRNFLQPDRLAHVRPVFDHGDNAAMIGLEMGRQDHQSEELVLREILAAEAGGVGRNRPGGKLDGLPGQRHRRPRHRPSGVHEAGIGSNDA